MKKRSMAILLCILMALSLLPGTALAATTEVKIGGVTLNAQTPYWKNGESTAEAAEPTGGWNARLTFNAIDEPTLTLRDATITGAESGGDNYGIYANSVLTIVLEGANSVTGGTATTGSYGVAVTNASLTISGTGSLTATGGTAGGTNSYGIYSYGNSVTVGDSATVTATGGEAAAISCGIYGNSVTVGDSATVTATGGEAAATSGGIYGSGSVEIIASATVTAVGGKATANSSSIGIFGVSVTVSGGMLTAVGGESTGSNSCGIYGITSVSISGGSVTAVGGKATAPSGSSYGIDGGSSVSISGGSVTAVGAVGGKAGTNSYGVHDTSGTITYTSGLLVAKGGTRAMNKVATGIFEPSSLLAGTNTADGMNKYIVFGDSSTYHVATGNVANSTAEPGHIEWSGSDSGICTLTNTIIIGDTPTETVPTALYLKDNYKTIVSNGFNVVLGADYADGSSDAVAGSSALTISGSGSLVAIGGTAGSGSSTGIGASGALTINARVTAVGGSTSVNSYGLTGVSITLTGGSGVAIAGSGTTAKATSVEPTCDNDYKTTTGAWDGKLYTWSVVPVLEVDLDGASGTGAPVQYTDFATGWNAAVAAGGTAESPVTVKLLKNWTADSSHSFGTGAGFGLTGTDTTNTGSILVPSGKYISLDLNGKTIDRGLTSKINNGNVISVRSGNLTVSDSSEPDAGKIKGGYAKNDSYGGGGGGVLVHDGSFTLTGGSITENNSFSHGGGVIVVEGSFMMAGGNITGNTSGLGGGVSIVSNGSFTMTDGSITGNTATIGGGVCVHDGSFTMSGGMITGNTSEYGGGVFTGDTFNVSGAPKIIENTSSTSSTSGTANNVYLSSDHAKILTVIGALTDNASIGVTTNSELSGSHTFTVAEGGGTTPHTITSGDAAKFFSDNAAYTTQLSDTGTVVLAIKQQGGGYVPPLVTNIVSNAGRDIWLSGNGLLYGDMLITEPNPAGADFDALRRLAGDAEIFNSYNIYLRSGKKSTGSEMYLKFALGADYAGQNFTLIHKPGSGSGDGKCEYFYSKAEDGAVAFGPLYELSPFLLLRGTVTPFADVSESDWFIDDVAYVFSKGMMEGVADTLFDPHGTTTRAMLVTILYRLEGEPADMPDRAPGQAFSDVAEGAWYAKAVQWAQLCGIVDGYGDGTFRPSTPITREQLAAILYRYVQYQGGGFTGAWMFPLRFPDAEQVSDWAYEAMCWCSMNGIISGNSDGTLAPQSQAERCQTAAILHRFCENPEK